MKLPFGYFLGPLFKRYHTEINHICKPCLFGSQIYLSAFSLFALVITMFDLFYILGNGSAPPSALSYLNPSVCPALLKNAKLISIGLNLNTYFLLILGVSYKYPVFLMLYLTLNFINVLLYLFLVIFSMLSKWQHFEKKNLLLISFMGHNWLQVFCFFRSCLHIGDF